MSLRSWCARALVLGAFALPALLVPKDADASVSIAVAFDALVKDADVVAVINPIESYSVWEDGRICSYTKIKVDQGVAGDLGAGSEGWVRTLGGVVGKIGQLVDGEPVFVTGKQSLLFLRHFKTSGVFEVSARAQGQYPVVLSETKKVKTLRASTAAGVLLPPKKVAVVEGAGPQPQSASGGAANEVVSKSEQPRLAQEVLHEKPLDEVSREIASTWRRLHPTPSK